MKTFKQFLTESARTKQVRSLFENWDPSYDDKPKNEFGEEQKKVGSGSKVWKRVSAICDSVQKDPDEKGPKKDSATLEVMHEVGDHYVAVICGGANGSGEWTQYLALMKKLAAGLKKEFGDVWLLDLANDCADDVWSLRLCFRDGEKDTK